MPGPAAAGPRGRGRPAAHRRHRVAGTSRGLEDASLDAGEAGALEVQTDELGMSRAVAGGPDGHRLGREAAVREADHRRGAGAQHARDLGQDGHGALEILDRDADQCGVDAGRVERQARLGVEVLHEMPGQARVGGEFGRVQAVAGDAGITDLVRQVADPTRHQVEDVAARRDDLPVEVGDRPDGGGIDMGHGARLRVERGIGIAVGLGERLGGKVRQILRHRRARLRVERRAGSDSRRPNRGLRAPLERARPPLGQVSTSTHQRRGCGHGRRHGSETTLPPLVRPAGGALLITPDRPLTPSETGRPNAGARADKPLRPSRSRETRREVSG